MDWQKSIRFYRNTGTPDSASFFLEDSAIVTIERYEDVWPSPLLFDMDNDEDLDLMVSMRETVWPGAHPVHFFKNIGEKYTPVWANEDTSYVMPYGVYDYWDYDNDNDYDLICGPNGYAGNNSLIFENTGNADSAYYTSNGILDSLYMDSWIYGYGTISLVDIDADGDKDAFLGNDFGGIFFYRNDGLVGIKDNNNIVTENFILYQNYPNPFNPVTTINYQLPKASKVKLEIFNVLGQKIRTLIDEQKEAAYYKLQWDGLNDYRRQTSTGIYFYRLTAQAVDGSKQFIKNKKMLLIR